MKRKNERVLKPILLICTIIIIAVALLRFLFVVRTVRVEGASPEAKDAIVRAAEVDFGGSLLLADRDRMMDNVNHMGTYRAEGVDVNLPNGLTIRVTERVPAAMTLFSGSILILDAEGIVISAASEVPDMDIAYISDMKPTAYQPGEVVRCESRHLDAYKSVIAAVIRKGASPYISEIRVSDPNAIRIITRANTDVRLGGTENIEDKIALMKSIVADLESRGQFGGTLHVINGEKADYMPYSGQNS